MHTVPSRHLRIVQFDATDRARYLKWDQFRTDIFAGELGWKMRRRQTEGDLADPHDRHGVFLSAEYEGQPIGILRAIHVIHGFPHQELFERALSVCDLNRRLDIIGTVNALAVLPQHRGVTYTDECDGADGTAATHLLRHSLKHFAASGCSVVLATVLSAISARVFIRAGFRILDTPFPSADHRFVLANVGRVDPAAMVGDNARWDDRWSLPSTVASYFDSQHVCVVGERTLEDLFATEVTGAS